MGQVTPRSLADGLHALPGTAINYIDRANLGSRCPS
jgi:hypothetical protein